MSILYRDHVITQDLKLPLRTQRNELLQYWQPEAASLLPLANKVENIDRMPKYYILKVSLSTGDPGLDLIHGGHGLLNDAHCRRHYMVHSDRQITLRV